MRAARPRPLRWAARLLLVSIVVAATLGWGGVYLLQDRLIFAAQPYPAGRNAELAAAGAEPFTVAVEGIVLRGWLKKPAGADGRLPLLLYFGGNAEDASAGLEQIPPGWAMAAVHYRGYGDSGGEPGEAELKADALRIFDQLARRDDIDPTRLVAVGRSLGSGVAVALAAARPSLAGVVLVTPYDSIASVAGRYYPWVPVDWLLRHRFDSLALAPTIRVPALFVLAGRDAVVPLDHSAKLYAAWGGPKQQLLLTEADHFNVMDEQGYDLANRSFLAGLARRPEAVGAAEAKDQNR